MCRINRIAYILIIALGLCASAALHGDALTLIDAAQNNDIEAAYSLIREGADVTAVQADGATALHWAAHWNEIELANRLLQAGAEVNARNELGVAPIALACRNGSVAMASALLAGGADPRSMEPSGETALMACSRTGSAAAVMALLVGGADPNALESSGEQSALMWAAAGKHTATVAALIRAGAAVDIQSANGFTPLMFAARAGALEAAQVLVEAGASVNTATAVGHSPLLIAAASIDAITGSDYRLVVQESKHEALGLFLLEHGANVAQADQYGMTPLHYAVEMNKPALLKALLEQGADPNAEITQELPFRRGDYVGREAYKGASPFWLAARLGNVAMMRDMLAAGADPELRQAWGVTPLMVAAGVTQTDSRIVEETKLLDAVKMLAIEIGADIQAVDRGGQTAIHGAANISGDEIIKFLVARGADPMAQDKQGNTPHDVATRTQRPRPVTAALLKELAGSMR